MATDIVIRWLAIKAIGVGVNTVLEKKPDVRDESQESDSNSTENPPNLGTVVEYEIGGSDGNFNSAREIVERSVAKQKSADKQFSEMMDRRIASGWDNVSVIRLQN